MVTVISIHKDAFISWISRASVSQMMSYVAKDEIEAALIDAELSRRLQQAGVPAAIEIFNFFDSQLAEKEEL